VKLIAKAILFVLALVAPVAHAGDRAARVTQFSVQCASYYAAAFGVPVELVDAVIQVESGWNPYAISSKGAAGLMQLMPATAIRFGVRDRFDIEDNIRGGVAYLAYLIQLFGGDLRLAVAAYNAGESLILLRRLEYSSPEVVDYVFRVARVYRALRTPTEGNPATAGVSTATGGER